MGKYAVHRKDANHDAIRDALERCGAVIYPGGPADLLVGFRGANYVIEVKTAKGKQNASQRAFQAAWRGQYALVRTVDEALAVIHAQPQRRTR